MSYKLQTLLVIAAVVLLRLPFLNQAIQGDEVYYLVGAQHALIEPLHPKHVDFAFNGKIVSMQGHTHPPFNVWYLGLILWIFGDVKEPVFHLAYFPFSIVAALACFALARRWSPQPLAATLLFMATPAFVINGTSLEADLPLLGFWMGSIALFIAAAEAKSYSLLATAMLVMMLAAMTGYQSAFLLPVCFLYLWCFQSKWKPAWAAAFTAPVVIAVWQIFERITTQTVPLAALAGNFQKYALQSLQNKLLNATALTIHLGASVSSFTLAFTFSRIIVPFVIGSALLLWCLWLARKTQPENRFLAGWILFYFAASLVLFFAGSARYLLPLAAPLAILLSRMVFPTLLRVAIVGNLVVSLGMAASNYQHWDQYRKIALSLSEQAKEKRVWINGDWLRFYLEASGALPVMEGQSVQPGEMVITSKLAYPSHFNTGGGMRVLTRQWPVHLQLPFQLIGLDAHSGYSTVAMGLESFGFAPGKAVDIVTAEVIVEKKATQPFVNMGDANSESQIASGFYSIEDGRWRWMSGKGVVLLKREPQHHKASVTYAVPDSVPGRLLEIFADGQSIGQKRLSGPGPGEFSAELPTFVNDQVTITITIDRTLTPLNDQRSLGAIISSVRLLK